MTKRFHPQPRPASRGPLHFQIAMTNHDSKLPPPAYFEELAAMQLLVPRAKVLAALADAYDQPGGAVPLAQIEEPAALTNVSKEQYARMFGAACEALGQISDCLGINSDINPGAEPIIAAIEQLRAGKTHPVLDDRWKARMLDGRAIERDEMGMGDHPDLPWLDEGMKPRSFFAALRMELAHTSAEDQLDDEALEAMGDLVNWADWQPTPPQGDGWKLVSIFDTEDGPVSWWLRELPEAEDGTTTIRNLQAEVEKFKERAAEGVDEGQKQ